MKMCIFLVLLGSCSFHKLIIYVTDRPRRTSSKPISALHYCWKRLRTLVWKCGVPMKRQILANL